MAERQTESLVATIVEQGGFWALVLTALAGLIGWRIGAAQDAVKIQYNHDKVDRLEERISALERGDAADGKELAATLATINTTLQQIHKGMERLDQRIASLEDTRRKEA